MPLEGNLMEDSRQLLRTAALPVPLIVSDQVEIHMHRESEALTNSLKSFFPFCVCLRERMIICLNKSKIAFSGVTKLKF